MQPNLVGKLAESQGGIQWSTQEVETQMRDPINGKTIYRKCVDFGALPSSTTKNVAHSISGLNVAAGAWFRFEAFCTDGTNICDMKLLTNLSVCTITATNCTVTTGADLSGYDGFFLIEYTKT